MSTTSLTRADLQKFLPDLRSVRVFEDLIANTQSSQNYGPEIAALQSGLASTNAEVDALQVSLNQTNADVQSLSTSVGDTNTTVAALQASLTLVSSDLQTLTTYVYANLPPDYGTY